MTKVEYDERLRPVDENIVQLLNERKQITESKPYIPPKTMLEAWSEQYGLDFTLLQWLFHGLFHTHNDFQYQPYEPGALRQVIPLMQTTLQDGVEYVLTHMMQYENGSEVHLKIQLQAEDAHRIDSIQPNLRLAVEPAEGYSIRHNGSQGGGPQAHLSFLVTPALPDDLGAVRFALLPSFREPRVPRKERVLDEPVVFATEEA
ncbi:hypothetical protein O9H32_23195 [Paenibacillus mucilaginosus]|nr:hypothetical protein [Paenibacillus caseinilyticus]